MLSRFMLPAFFGAMIILLTPIAMAQVACPHQFKGKVITNGVPAPDGLPVVARIEGEDVLATTTVNGNYGRSPGEMFIIKDTVPPEESRYGKTVEFYVSGIKAAEYVYSYCESDVVDLSVTGDLGVCGDNYCGSGETCSSCSQDCGQCQQSESQSSSSSSSSSGISGSFTPSTCDESWTCSAWSICSKEGMRFRSCTDDNGCGTENEKPAVEESCTYEPAEVPSVCPEGVRICSEGKLQDCPDGSYWRVIEICEFGCDPDSARCMPEPGSDSGAGSESGAFTGLFSAANAPAIFGMIIVVIVVCGLFVYWMKYR